MMGAIRKKLELLFFGLLLFAWYQLVSMEVTHVISLILKVLVSHICQLYSEYLHIVYVTSQSCHRTVFSMPDPT